jgi:hypothetical protein
MRLRLLAIVLALVVASCSFNQSNDPNASTASCSKSTSGVNSSTTDMVALAFVGSASGQASPP